MTDIQKVVERTIYETIRLLLVRDGYLPDITDVAYAQTALGQQAWDNDLDAIQQAKGFAVEIFGHSSSQDKGFRKVPRIVISPTKVIEGDLGMSFVPIIEEDPLSPGNFVKVQPPYDASDLTMEVILVSNQPEQHRYLHGILSEAIGKRKFLYTYDDNGIKSNDENFLAEQTSYYDVMDTEEGVVENTYGYSIKDLFLFEGTVLYPIKKIDQIKVEPYLGDQVTNTKDDDLIIP